MDDQRDPGVNAGELFWKEFVMLHLKALKVYHRALILLRLDAALVLCDQRSSFMAGQVITVDEGKTKLIRAGCLTITHKCIFI